ncbi:hypothetical protein HK096_000165, partial [Nowakowskiella sp. JEL0078]
MASFSEHIENEDTADSAKCSLLKNNLIEVLFPKQLWLKLRNLKLTDLFFSLARAMLCSALSSAIPVLTAYFSKSCGFSYVASSTSLLFFISGLESVLIAAIIYLCVSIEKSTKKENLHLPHVSKLFIVSIVITLLGSMISAALSISPTEFRATILFRFGSRVSEHIVFLPLLSQILNIGRNAMNNHLKLPLVDDYHIFLNLTSILNFMVYIVVVVLIILITAISAITLYPETKVPLVFLALAAPASTFINYAMGYCGSSIANLTIYFCYKSISKDWQASIVLNSEFDFIVKEIPWVMLSMSIILNATYVSEMQRDLDKVRNEVKMLKSALDERDQMKRTIEGKNRVFSYLMHDLRGSVYPLSYLVTHLNKKIDNLSKINSEISVLPEKLNQINNEISSLLRISKSLSYFSQFSITLLSEYLDSEQLSQGQMTLKLEQTDLRKLLSQICKGTAEILQIDSIRCTLNIDEKVPRTLVTDTIRYSQIIQNLLTNAWKFTQSDGEIKISVRVVQSPNHLKACFELRNDSTESFPFTFNFTSTRIWNLLLTLQIGSLKSFLKNFFYHNNTRSACASPDIDNKFSTQMSQSCTNDSQLIHKSTSTQASINSINTTTIWIETTVIDTGVGMAPETLASLFQPFSQGLEKSFREVENEAKRSSGLGLSIVHMLTTTLFGGEIFVESHENIGTSFRVMIPMKLSAQFELVSSQLVQSPTLSESVSEMSEIVSLLQILVVDDDNMTRMVFVRILTKCLPKCEITQAESGRSALNVLETKVFNLIFLDFCLSDTKGDELAIKLRASGCHSPIVLVTAMDVMNDRDCRDYNQYPGQLKIS